MVFTIWPMPDVDVLAVWNRGRTVFVIWFAATIPIATFLYLSISTRLSAGKSVLANVATRVYRGSDQLGNPGRAGRGSQYVGGVRGSAGAKERVTYFKLSSILGMNLMGVGIPVWRVAAYVVALLTSLTVASN